MYRTFWSHHGNDGTELLLMSNRSRDMEEMIEGWQRAALQSSSTVLQEEEIPTEPTTEENLEPIEREEPKSVSDPASRLRELLAKGKNRVVNPESVNRK